MIGAEQVPLNISLKPRERLVVNGAVIRNRSGRHPLTIEFLNRVNFMREREIVMPEQANTPLLRIIYWLQIAYIDPEQRTAAEQRFLTLVRDLHDAVAIAELRSALTEATALMRAGKFGAALKRLRDALPLERAMLAMSSPIEIAPMGTELEAAIHAAPPATDGLDSGVSEETFDPRSC